MLAVGEGGEPVSLDTYQPSGEWELIGECHV